MCNRKWITKKKPRKKIDHIWKILMVRKKIPTNKFWNASKDNRWMRIYYWNFKFFFWLFGCVFFYSLWVRVFKKVIKGNTFMRYFGKQKISHWIIFFFASVSFVLSYFMFFLFLLLLLVFHVHVVCEFVDQFSWFS